jgi:hypothetical protein
VKKDERKQKRIYKKIKLRLSMLALATQARHFG